MRQLLELTKRGAALLPGRAAAHHSEPAAVEPKAPPGLPLAFMLSHLEDDGPVRLDRQKLGVCEVLGLELDEPKLGAFAGALNACDFPLQLLVRQHPPGLGKLRDDLEAAQPANLPARTRKAAESLRRLLGELEAREGILDRRFYAVCEHERMDELRSLLVRAGLSIHPLTGRQLRMLVLASALGGSPREIDEDAPTEVVVNRREIKVGGHLTRSLHLAKWPRSLSPGFLQGLLADGRARWTSHSTSGRSRPPWQRARWSGRRCASSRHRASPCERARASPRRRRSRSRT